MVKAHLGTTIDEALNSQKLQGKIPSDFLSATAQAVDSAMLGGLLASQYLRNDVSGTIAGSLTLKNDQYFLANGVFGLSLQNSDITGINSLIFNDQSDDSTEGILFLKAGKTIGSRTIADYTSLRVDANGVLFLDANQVFHQGNKSSFLVSQSVDGFMSIADKTKLDNIQTSAINQTTADARYQLKEYTMFTNMTTYIAVRSTGRTASQYYEFWDSVGWAGIKSGTHDVTGDVTVTGNISVNGTVDGVDVSVLNTNYNAHVGSGGASHALASTTVHGFMDFNDKVKLNAIQASAINQATADGRYLQLTGGTLSNELTLSTDDKGITFYGNARIYKKSGNGLKIQAHSDAIGVAITNVAGTDMFVVKTDGTGMTYNSNVVFHTGNKSSYLVTTSVDGFMSATDKTKLNGIATGAEVNQNAFGAIAVSGQTTVNALSKNSTLTFIAGTGMAITNDASGMTVSFTSNLTNAYLALDGSNTMAGNISFTTGTKSINFPTTKLRDNGTGSLIISSTGTDKTIYLRANGDMDTTNELKLTAGALTLGGNTVWTSGNLDPTTKLDKTGGTLTGSLTVNGGDILISRLANDAKHTIASYGNGSSLWLMSPSPNNPYLLMGDSLDWDRQIGIKYTIGTVGASASVLQIGQVQKNNTNWTHGSTELWAGGASRMVIGTSLITLNTSVRGTQSGALRIDSGTGYIDIGAKTTSWAHMYTDRYGFYLDKTLVVNGGVLSSFSTFDLTLSTGDNGSGGLARVTVKNSNGYVGIGTNAPAYMLEVSGDIKNNGSFHSANPYNFYDANGASQTVRLGGLTISSAYSDSSKQPVNGIYSKGDVYTDGVVNVSNKVKIQWNATENSLDFVFI